MNENQQPDPSTLSMIRNVPLQEGDYAVNCFEPGHFLKVHPNEYGKLADRQDYSYFRPITPPAAVEETCPQCGRRKAASLEDAASGLCPKWWAVRDPDAVRDCERNTTPPAERPTLASKEWFERSAEIEGDSEVGAGIAPAERPTPITDALEQTAMFRNRPQDPACGEALLHARDLERQLAEKTEELEKSKRGHNSCAGIRDRWKARAQQSEKELAEAREQRDTAMRRANNIAVEALVLAEQRDRLADALEAMREYYRGHMITPALYNRVEKALAAVKGGPQ